MSNIIFKTVLFLFFHLFLPSVVQTLTLNFRGDNFSLEDFKKTDVFVYFTNSKLFAYKKYQ